MKLQLKITRIFFKTLSFLFPRLAAKIAFKLFQKVRKKDIRKREKLFYEKAKRFEVVHNNTELHCYELGNPKGEVIFLVHGWDSNAGSLSRFTFEFAGKNYRVITFDLPSHANSKDTHTNLRECKEAFQALLNHINPQKPIKIVSHSFGSGVVAYALSEMDLKIDKMVFLTSPNYFMHIFCDFKNFINLRDKAFKHMVLIADDILDEKLKDVIVAKKLKQISYNQILIIHDENDKIVPYSNSLAIKDSNKNIQLKSYKRIGHYRMLWIDEVINDAIAFIGK